MTTLIKTDLDQPVQSRRELIDYLARGARPPERWGIGVEMEKLVIDPATGEAAPFVRIEALLEAISAAGEWREVREGGRLLALLGADSSITLEPGGQLELSGKLCPDLFCCQGDFSRHVEQIVTAGRSVGLAFLGLGVQPFTPLERIASIPKSRYGIMAPIMRRTGDMGERMMKQSAGLQVNLDYADEADCLAKLRLSLAMAPLLYALFANSPLLDGRPSGFLSTRGEIWSRTDPDRTGLLPELFRPGAGFADYVEYALRVPMYFIFRDGHFIDCSGPPFPFGRYLEEGFGPYRATLADWDLHLSTLFPEARLRPQIEVRCADSLPPHLALSFAALMKGLLYDRQALEHAWSLFSWLDAGARENLYRQSWRLGLKTPLGKRTLRETAVEILGAARLGLQRQGRRNHRGLDEGVFLDELEEIAAGGVTLAERLLARWPESRPEQVALLLDHCGY